MPIILDKVSHIYGEGTAMAVKALDDISIVIPVYRVNRAYWFWKVNTGSASEWIDESDIREYLLQW